MPLAVMFFRARRNLANSGEPHQPLMLLMWGGRHGVLSRTSVGSKTSHVQDTDPIRLDMPLVVHKNRSLSYYVFLLS